MTKFLKENTHKIIAQYRQDSQVYKKHALPLKAKGESFSHDVIGKDCTGLLGIICYDYEAMDWISHTDQFNLENDFVWSYPTKALIEEPMSNTNLN